MKATNILKGLMLAPLAALVACGPSDDNNDNNGTNRPDPSTCVVLEQADVETGADLDGCYLVENRLSVASGKLNIAPGSTFYFATGIGLAVRADAVLDAAGTDAEPILFTHEDADRGAWQGLLVDSASSTSKLVHVVVEHAGGAKWHGGADSGGGVTTQSGARLQIENSIFRNNAIAGVHVLNPDATVTVTNTTFENNLRPIWVASEGVGGLSDLTFEDNDEELIRVDAGTVSTQTWRSHDVPYQFMGRMNVTGHVTIEAGAEFMFQQDTGLHIHGEGRLTAVGTADAPILMYGADQTPGFWRGLFFEDTLSTDNVLDYVTLEHAGGAKWHGGAQSQAGIFVRGASALAIRNSTFRHNVNAAIIVDNDASKLTVEGSAFEANDAPLRINPEHVGGLSADNMFTDEGPIELFQGTLASTATWVALSVPYRARGTTTVKGALTLSPGTRFEFVQDVGLDINGGTLVADAEGNDEIVFTASDEGLNGFWKGIRFVDTLSSTNVIANATVSYGGSSGWHGGNYSRAGIFIDDSAVALKGVAVTHSGSYGISTVNATVSSCDVTLSDNTGDELIGDTALASCN